jgi:hypothetical protein
MENKEDIINDILGELQVEKAIPITLPSRGVAYNFDNPDNKEVYLRPMTFEDEKVLSSARKLGKDPSNLLLERCIENLKVDQLYPFDKLYLIMKLREISYGEDYKARVVCSKCQGEADITVNINKLPIREVEEDFQDPIEIYLPKIGKKAKVSFPRVRDEKYFTSSESVGDHLWRFVTEINGVSDKVIIAEVIKKLPLVDIKTILKSLSLEYGIETKIHFVCDLCGGGSIIELPINENFFNVN